MLADQLRTILGHVRLAPFLLRLDTGTFQPTVAILRSVWGAALHAFDRAAYDAVFAPDSQVGSPGYILAHDPADPAAFHWRLVGAGLEHVPSLRRAWDIAAVMGLGSQRQRFVVREFLPLGPNCEPVEPPDPWTLDRIVWPLTGNPASTPCRLVFPAGVRLLRDKHLLIRPTFADVAVACLRRLFPLLPDLPRGDLDELHDTLVEMARHWPARPWRGHRQDLHRWSARQKQEIELQGVKGELELPEGPGDLWPLLAGASWLHIGKNTTVGLGQMLVRQNAPQSVGFSGVPSSSSNQP
jgi:hypothetical protein